jgi:hypothetical protein
MARSVSFFAQYEQRITRELANRDRRVGREKYLGQWLCFLGAKRVEQARGPMRLKPVLELVDKDDRRSLSETLL